MALNDSIRAFDGLAPAASAKEASHFSPLDGSISLAASDFIAVRSPVSDHPIDPRVACRAHAAILAQRSDAQHISCRLNPDWAIYPTCQLTHNP